MIALSRCTQSMTTVHVVDRNRRFTLIQRTRSTQGGLSWVGQRLFSVLAQGKGTSVHGREPPRAQVRYKMCSKKRRHVTMYSQNVT